MVGPPGQGHWSPLHRPGGACLHNLFWEGNACPWGQRLTEQAARVRSKNGQSLELSDPLCLTCSASLGSGSLAVTGSPQPGSLLGLMLSSLWWDARRLHCPP